MVIGKYLTETGGGRPGQATELTPEEVSQLMDGELDAERVEHACHGLRESAAMETWVCYHVIGDTLRGCGGLSPGFAERFAARFGAEPTVLGAERAVMDWSRRESELRLGGRCGTFVFLWLPG